MDTIPTPRELPENIEEWSDEIEELNSIVPKGYDEDEANQRMDIIGQNGPTGEHYDKNQTELEL